MEQWIKDVRQGQTRALHDIMLHVEPILWPDQHQGCSILQQDLTKAGSTCSLTWHREHDEQCTGRRRGMHRIAEGTANARRSIGYMY